MLRDPVLLVGCGRWGRNILRDLAGIGLPTIVVDPSAQALAAAAQLAHATYETLDVDERIAGVIVATPATNHVSTIEQVARWRVPIFVEKPLAVSTEEAERADAVAGDRLFVMDKWRYHPGVEALGALARSGELGSVRAVRTWRLGWSEARPDVDPIWTLLSHDLSIVREILGFLPPATHAVAERWLGAASGITAWLGTGPTCVIDVSARRPGHRRLIEIAFDGAVAVLDGSRDAIVEVRADGGDRTISVANDPPLRRELEAFARHLDGGPAPRSCARDGVEAVRRICELRRMAGLHA